MPRSRLLLAFGRALGLVAYAALGRERRRARSGCAWASGATSGEFRRASRVRHDAGRSSPTSSRSSIRASPRIGARRSIRSRVVFSPSALAEGRGVVFVSAHVGPWERMAARARGRRVLDLDRRARELRSAPHRGLRADSRAARRPVDLPRQPGRRARHRAGARARAGSWVSSWICPGGSRAPRAPLRISKAAIAVGPARIALRAARAVVVGTPRPGSEGGAMIEGVRSARLRGSGRGI